MPSRLPWSGMQRSATSILRTSRGSSCCPKTDRTVRIATLALIVSTLPLTLGAQARIVADPMPIHSTESQFAGARLMRSGIASQFDSLGHTPLGRVGDSVTAYLFTYNDVLSRVVHARIA